eukprot:5800187-Pleurochrysis_carterae.AAC.1
MPILGIVEVGPILRAPAIGLLQMLRESLRLPAGSMQPSKCSVCGNFGSGFCEISTVGTAVSRLFVVGISVVGASGPLG